MRAGAQALTMAADPVNREILLACSDQVLEMGGRQYTLGEDGREALFVAGTIERWLQWAPCGPIEYGTSAAKRAVSQLVEGWSLALVHALAREPMTAAELDAALDGLDRRELQHRLNAMRSIGMVDALGAGADALYEITDWLRLGIAPLIASARLERSRRMSGATPVDGLDVDAGFRMALGVVELPVELSGVCRMRLNLDEGRDDRLSGVTARIERSEVVSFEAGIEAPADAWALGTLDGWLDTVIDLDAKAVRTGGDEWLTAALVRAIHGALFAPVD
jgi:DNA-binding transcriptional ArsR family regulator